MGRGLVVAIIVVASIIGFGLLQYACAPGGDPNTMPEANRCSCRAAPDPEGPVTCLQCHSEYWYEVYKNDACSCDTKDVSLSLKR